MSAAGVPRTARGVSLLGAALALGLFGITVASGYSWLHDRQRARTATEAARQLSAVAIAARTLVTSNFTDYLATVGAAGQLRIAPQELINNGVLPASFPTRSPLNRPWRISLLPDGTTAITLLVHGSNSSRFSPGAAWPADLHGTEAPVGIVTREPLPGCPAGNCIVGPRVLADTSAFRAAWPDASSPGHGQFASIARIDRDSVCGDYLYRVDVSARCGAGANRMETALDMGNNNIIGAGAIDANSIEVDSDFLVQGTLTANQSLAVAQRLEVSGNVEVRTTLFAETITSAGQLTAPSITVNGPLEAASMAVTGALSADSMTVAGELAADTVNATGSLRTGRLEAPTVASTANAEFNFVNVTGQLTTTNVAATRRLDYDGDLEDVDVTVGTLRVTGPATFDGPITVQSGGCTGC